MPRKTRRKLTEAERPGITERRRAREAYEEARRTSEPGEGKRFAALAESARVGGARNPEAVAAKVMWEKYGKKGGAALIKKGKARAKRG